MDENILFYRRLVQDAPRSLSKPTGRPTLKQMDSGTRRPHRDTLLSGEQEPGATVQRGPPTLDHRTKPHLILDLWTLRRSNDVDAL